MDKETFQDIIANNFNTIIAKQLNIDKPTESIILEFFNDVSDETILTVISLITECKWNFNYCKVAQSPIHGYGVFATQSITKGQYITLYPPDIVRCSNKYNLPHIKEKYSKRRGSHDYSYIRKYYSAQCIKNKFIITGDPVFRYDPDFLGHMLNDSAIVKDDTYIPCDNKTNCEITIVRCEMFPISVIVATKDIQEGEELLLSYGKNYWEN